MTGPNLLPWNVLQVMTFCEETATRLVDPPSITAIIVDPPRTTRGTWAWQGPVAALSSIGPKDRDGLRKAMEATVPLNGELARLAMADPCVWEPAAGVLKAMVPIVLGTSPIGCDPLLGVIGPGTA